MIRSFSFGLRRRRPLTVGFALTAVLAAGSLPLVLVLILIPVLIPVLIPTEAQAQDPFLSSSGSASSSAKSKKQQASHPNDKNAPQPSLVLPTGPLGFASPAPFYLGDRFAQASLNFLDEDTLLFTFRVPGLIAREPAAPGQPSQDQRHIRALTLSLPDGKVTAEGLWVLHDYSRYLWMLKDKKFLVRDKNLLQIGDASLHMEPFLRFPGPITTIEFDPNQNWLVADTTEPPAPEQKDSNSDAAGPFSSSTASASVAVNGHLDLEKSQSTAQDLVRVLNMDTRKVTLFSRVNAAIHLPIDGEGYYEALRGDGSHWMVSFEYFNGASRPLGWIESTCNPSLDALASGIVLASGCTATGARHLTVLSRDRDKDHCRLWDAVLSPTKIWPVLASSADGLRLARATLEVSHPIGPYNPLDNEDIRGQSVQVYDLATGKVELTVPASPVLDAGGNFALSPSGRRFAVLNAGNILVFDLPPAPQVEPLPDPNSTAAKP
jgi:hypothetical protein